MKKFKCAGGRYYGMYMPTNVDADANGVVYEHRYIASKILNRPLKKEEYVHHKDNNGLNNAEENLMVFASNSDHIAFHHGATIICVDQVWYAIQEEKVYACKICGANISGHGKMDICASCYKAIRGAHIPSRETLEELLREQSLSSIARLYHVSPNAVSKWLKKYGIYHPMCPRYSRQFICECLQYATAHTHTETCRHYNIDRSTLLRWIGDTSKKNAVKKILCVETNTIFGNGKAAASTMFPFLKARDAGGRIRQAAKNGNVYHGYHWQEI